MAAIGEDRMNLAALQQRDPYITDIVDTASQVALYSFSSKGNEWEKTSIEGTLFVYKRSASPINGFMILNRLGLNNLIEPIIKDLEFQLQDPFLLYRNTKAIFGIWFYDKDECTRLGQLMNDLVQLAIEHHNAKSQHALRQRRASESDTGQEQQEVMTDPHQVDIIQMLSKAQNEYVKSKGGTSVKGKAEPKPMIDNPNAAATKTTQLIRPMPLKLSSNPKVESESTGGGSESADLTGGTTPNTAISLEALFRNASKQRSVPAGEVLSIDTSVPPPTMKTAQRSISMSESVSSLDPDASTHPTSQSPRPLHPILQKLMSTGSMVESIERQHIAEQLSPRHPPGPAGDMPASQRDITSSMVSSTSQERMSFSIVKPSISSIQESPDSTTSFLSPEPSPAAPQTMMLPPASSKAGPDKSSARKLEERIANICSAPLAISSGGSLIADTSLEASQLTPPDTTGLKTSLLTPAVFESGPASLITEQQQPPLAGSLPTPAFNPDVLLSPMVFLSTSSSRLSPPNVPGLALGETTHMLPHPSKVPEFSASGAPAVAALTKEQLQQALLYLLKNDPNFMSTIHEAYLKSLTAGLSSHKS